MLIYRARSEPDLVFRRDLDELAVSRGVTVHYVTGERIPGRQSWLPRTASHLTDEEALRRLVPELTERDVFVCGSPLSNCRKLSESIR